MSERFGEAVLRLLPLAARSLGWTPDLFWSATPADLAAALADPGAPDARRMTCADLDRLLELDQDG